MGQTGWRLPDDLLKRVRVHCAQTGERQNEFVRQALENALVDDAALPLPRGAAKLLRETFESPLLSEQEVQGVRNVQRLGKGFVPPRPKGT